MIVAVILTEGKDCRYHENACEKDGKEKGKDVDARFPRRLQQNEENGADHQVQDAGENKVFGESARKVTENAGESKANKKEINGDRTAAAVFTGQAAI